MINHQTDQAMAYIPRHVDDYLHALNSARGRFRTRRQHPAQSIARCGFAPPDGLGKKGSRRFARQLDARRAACSESPTGTFSIPATSGEIALGHVSITGNRASAEVYYQGTLTALRLPFIKEGDAWKIDVMALLPYAEVLMRVDRAIKGETEAQQVDQLVSKLPSL